MKTQRFTIIELLVAMVVLVLMMMFLMRFFTSTEDLMNRTTGKNDQFERARVAMDLIASDLQCISYTEGVDTICYCQTDSGSTTTTRLSIPVLRTEKPSDAKTTLAYVTYKYDADNFKLQTVVCWDDDATWQLDRVSNNVNTVMPDPSGTLEDVIDGVISFHVTPCKIGSGGALTALTAVNLCATSPSDKRRIPDVVKIELEVMDKETLDQRKALAAVGDEIPDALDPTKSDFVGATKTRSFSREIALNRGQF